LRLGIAAYAAAAPSIALSLVVSHASWRHCTARSRGGARGGETLRRRRRPWSGSSRNINAAPIPAPAITPIALAAVPVVTHDSSFARACCHGRDSALPRTRPRWRGR
jgi:hypothetical protein